MSTAIVVLGMHRSGTSAVAGALELMGVRLGRVIDAGADNPKGFFENERAVAIHEDLLRELGSSWDDVRELPEGWAHSSAAERASQQVVGLIDEEFGSAEMWAIKDPRLCRLLPIWEAPMRRPDVRTAAILVVRHPEEVARSIAARNGWDVRLGRLLWLRHVVESERNTRSLRRSVLTYDALLADPGASMSRLARELDITLVPLSAPLEDFVDGGERHQDTPGSAVEAGDSFAAAVAAVYASLVEIEHGSGDWDDVVQLAADAVASLGQVLPYVDAVADQTAAARREAEHWRLTGERIDGERAAAEAESGRWKALAAERQAQFEERLADRDVAMPAITRELDAAKRSVSWRIGAVVGRLVKAVRRPRARSVFGRSPKG